MVQALASPSVKEDVAGFGFDSVYSLLYTPRNKYPFSLPGSEFHIFSIRVQNVVLHDFEKCHRENFPQELWKRFIGETGTSVKMRPWRQLPALSNLMVFQPLSFPEFR